MKHTYYIKIQSGPLLVLSIGTPLCKLSMVYVNFYRRVDIQSNLYEQLRFLIIIMIHAEKFKLFKQCKVIRIQVGAHAIASVICFEAGGL